MDESSYLDRIASLDGFRHYPGQGPWGRKSGSVIGLQDGYLTIIGFDRDRKQAKIVILLRFKKMYEPELLKAAVAQSGAAKGEKQARLAAAGNDFLRWEWLYSVTKPKAEEVVQLSNSLLAAIKPVVAGLDGRCEKCRRTSAPDLTLMNGLPIQICAGCQAAVHQENDQAAVKYSLIQPNYPNGLVLGAGAAILGAIAWGAVAFTLGHVFVYGAILIGYFVSQSMIKGTGKVTLFGQVCIPILTVGSILLGDVIFFTLFVMRAQNHPFTMELLLRVLVNFGTLEQQANGLFSVLFGLIGAGFALYATRKPKFKTVFEPLRISAT